MNVVICFETIGVLQNIRSSHKHVRISLVYSKTIGGEGDHGLNWLQLHLDRLKFVANWR